MHTLSDLLAEPQGGPGGGAPVRRHTKTLPGHEGRFWQPFRRGQASRYLLAAERYDRTGRLAHRADRNRRHNGPLGHVALDVLRYLLRIIDFKSGRLDPAILTIANRIGRSPAAVVAALQRLKRHGFLDWLRRYEPTQNEGRGPQVRQTSNAYRLALPAAAEALLPAEAPPPDCETDRRVRAVQEARAMILEDPSNALGQVLSRLGRLVQQRDSTAQSESPTSSFIQMRNGLRP